MKKECASYNPPAACHVCKVKKKDSKYLLERKDSMRFIDFRSDTG